MTGPVTPSHRRDPAPATAPADAPAPVPPAQARPAPAQRRRPVTQEQRDEALNLPLVRQVIDLFDARLVDLREPPKPQPPSDKEEG